MDACVEHDVDFNAIGTVAFLVTNNKPEDRTVMLPQHVTRLTTGIEVKRWEARHRHPEELRLILEQPEAGFSTTILNLRGFAAHIERVIRETRRWSLAGRVSFPKLIGLPALGHDWEASKGWKSILTPKHLTPIPS